MKKSILKLIAISGMLIAMNTDVNAQLWSLTGNAGTTVSTNFIGTTDNVALRFRTKNVNRMTINTSGYVGIGTTSPTSKLEVKDGTLQIRNTTSSAALIINRDNTTSGTSNEILFAESSGNKWALGGCNLGSALGSNFSLYNYTTGSNVITILNSSNRIGIGTTAPAYKLHCVDSSSSSTPIYGENNYAGFPDGYGVIGNASDYSGFGIGVGGSGGYIGVQGFGISDTTGTAVGVYGYATGSAVGTRVGLWGQASGGMTTYGVYCSGSGISTGTWTAVSDQKFKKDIAPVSGALGLINQLNPVTYQMKREEYPMMNFPSFRQYGFIAQELEKVIPLLVENGTHPGAKREDKDIEFKAVNYTGMIPILAKAIQEQQKEIEELKSLVQQLTGNGKRLNTQVNTASLEQNAPNPFNESTIIKYYLPQTTASAVIKIYSAASAELNSIPVNSKGTGQVEISAKSLSPGTYTYMLIADGKAVDSKQMVLIK